MRIVNILNNLPSAIWTLLGVIVGAGFSFAIQYWRQYRQRLALAQVLFRSLNWVVGHINNFFVGQKPESTFEESLTGKTPSLFQLHYPILVQSTLPTYRLCEQLFDKLFHQERNVSGIVWIYEKLIVAEESRKRCEEALSTGCNFSFGWFQYCEALHYLVIGSTPHLLRLWDLSYGPLGRWRKSKLRRKLKEELEECEKRVGEKWPEFWKKLNQPNKI